MHVLYFLSVETDRVLFMGLLGGWVQVRQRDLRYAAVRGDPDSSAGRAARGHGHAE